MRVSKEEMDRFLSTNPDASFLIQEKDLGKLRHRFDEGRAEGEVPIGINPRPIKEGKQIIEITLVHSTNDETFGYEATARTVKPLYKRMFHMGHGFEAFFLAGLIYIPIYIVYRKIRYKSRKPQVPLST